jgi:hypothetical protein
MSQEHKKEVVVVLLMLLLQVINLCVAPISFKNH